MQTPHTRPWRESNPGPWGCEANVLNTKPPCALPLIIHPSIHPSSTAYLFQGHGELGAYPRKHRAQGGVHPGQGANPSQGTITHTLTHPFIHYGHFRHSNQPTMPVFGLEEETGVPGGNPRSTGEHANSAHTWPTVGIKP
ncbi:hypothetical protein AMELA_G00225230 [Ameiurus melas]|uniref:Uncharacterized protein n=1 Tax=Ameiurus melas TaxID=219545 RepID=A0A7J5ZZS3_AMEME|nr:hypothetical protein AMELA_G00225230 [Ameiurus melas]